MIALLVVGAYLAILIGIWAVARAAALGDRRLDDLAVHAVHQKAA